MRFLRDEGFSGFYKGLKPNLIRVIPACGLTFVIYEEMSHYLRERRIAKEEFQAHNAVKVAEQNDSSKK